MGGVTRQTIIFLSGVLVDWKVALVLPALHGLQEVNVKFHSKYERPVGGKKWEGADRAVGWQRRRRRGGGGVMGMHLNLAICFCQSLFRVKL